MTLDLTAPPRLVAYIEAFARAYGDDFAVTSIVRKDATAHARAGAVDFAFRSGPLAKLIAAGLCPRYYDKPDLIRKAKAAHDAAIAALAYDPREYALVVEVDHFHIEEGGLPGGIYRYAPRISRGPCATAGRSPSLTRL